MRALWLAVNEQFFARDPPPVETNEIKKEKATETTLTYAVTIKKWKTQTDKNGRERKNGKRNSRGRIILSTAHDFKHQHNISDFFFFQPTSRQLPRVCITLSSQKNYGSRKRHPLSRSLFLRETMK